MLRKRTGIATIIWILASGLAFLASFSVSDDAQAASVVINPDIGLDSQSIDQRFFWLDGLGAIDSIGTPGCNNSGCVSAFDPIWEITVTRSSFIDASAVDGFEPGDEFELVFDGSVLAWTNFFVDGSGLFHGQVTDLFLAIGTHTFTLNVTNLASGFNSGGAWMNFGPELPVPIPAALPLFGSGLAVMGWLGWRRNRKAPAAAN